MAFTEIDPVKQIPNSIHYHRKCYQRFTLKRDLANFNEHEHQQEIPMENWNIICVTKTMFILQKETDEKKKETESLKLCVVDRAEESIKFAAKKAGDYNVLSIPDLIAAEAHYHKSCYKQYLNVNYDKGIAEKDEYFDIEVALFEEVVKICLELQYQWNSLKEIWFWELQLTLKNLRRKWIQSGGRANLFKM